MADPSSRSNLKSPKNIPPKKMPFGANNLKLNGNLVGLPKQSMEIRQSPQYPIQQSQQISPAANLLKPSLHQFMQPASVAIPSHSSNSGHNFQTASSSSQAENVESGLHSIPPRYQPPPQPLGGILKNVPNPKTEHSSKSEMSAHPHAYMKYPPEVPKLASVYIPESFSQRQPPHRLPMGNIQIHQDHTHAGGAFQTHQQHLDLLKYIRKPDSDAGARESLGDTGAIVGMLPGRLSAEQNRHLQSLLAELRILKETNQRLSEDNQELRDLCCFLDDDRQKGRKLAREWQRFGRYTASVMRQEVAAYQNKLRQLDEKQQDLIRDNLELKELCLYLDEERAHIAAHALCSSCGTAVRPSLRDEGDGSSSSTNADENISNRRHLPKEPHIKSALSDQTMQYVRCLEQRIRQLEEGRVTHDEKKPDPISNRPEAVVRALQVLEVREQLESNRPNIGTSETEEQMDDGEKALVREMCNVVWRKLEESPNGPSIES